MRREYAWPVAAGICHLALKEPGHPAGASSKGTPRGRLGGNLKRPCGVWVHLAADGAGLRERGSVRARYVVVLLSAQAAAFG